MVRTAESVTEGVDLTGKTALVTGVNSGIGTETMRVLASRGARVIGTARTLEKARAACAGVEGECVPIACELTDHAAIRTCVANIQALDRPLEIVVANAGIMALPELQQVNGIEMQFATNHLGHFLLITSLLEQLRAADVARVVIVSSAAHMQAPAKGIDFDNLSGESGYSAWRAYGQSKLANVLFANALARRLPEHVTANSLHPGLISTNLGRNMNRGLAMVALGVVMFPFMISIPKGAATSCYVATHPDVEGVRGKYFADCTAKRAHKLSDDVGLQDRLWETSESLTAA
jgi:WW domain-containing oxidoreductase